MMLLPAANNDHDPTTMALPPLPTKSQVIPMHPVDMVVENLRTNRHVAKEVPKAIVKKTKTEYRWFERQHSLGTLGSHDNPLARAAALLEFTLRENGGNKIALKDLASASFKTSKYFTKFHQQVGNFRQQNREQQQQQKRGRMASKERKRSKPPKIDSAPVSSQSSSSVASTSSSGIRSSARLQRSSDVETPASLDALAAKLVLLNTEAYVARAQRLWRGLIEEKSEFMEKNVRRSHLYELRRYQPAYEAACFYLAVMRGKKGSKQQQQHPEGATEILTVEDILNVSKDFSRLEFDHALKYAQRVLGELLAELLVEPRSVKKRNSTGLDSDKSSAKRSRVEAIEQTAKQSRVEGIETGAFVGREQFVSKIDDSERHLTAPFLAWKSRVLREAIASELLQDQELSDQQAKSRAADRVLVRFGIIITRNKQ